ncbi:MAG TPA: hypothetical protein DD687_09060 [Verrucomicrobiales bacterium]|nr:hypothetical protein [Verrucomicrobiales bacterium]
MKSPILGLKSPVESIGPLVDGMKTLRLISWLFLLCCSQSKMNLKNFEGLPSVRNRVKVS